MTITEHAHSHLETARVLSDCAALVVPALRNAVSALPDPLWRVAGYHFGWLDEHGQPVALGGGKLIRPRLALLSARAVGGDLTDAVPAAVAVELVHNFSLLHDDIMDGDRTRRHRPTAWAVFGIPAALLAGDALLTLALRVLAEADAGAKFGKGTRILVAALMRMMDGQSADTNFPHRPQVSVAECEAMAAGKTGAVLGCACGLGALYGGAAAGRIRCLQEMGEHLGLAFQLADDLLGIWGDPAITGKPAGADLVNHKKSLPVVVALNSATKAGGELATLYRLDRPLTHAESNRAADLVEAAGGRAWTQARAEHHLERARMLLRQADLDPVVAEELSTLTEQLSHRNY